jgi:hypothetical protein
MLISGGPASLAITISSLSLSVARMKLQLERLLSTLIKTLLPHHYYPISQAIEKVKREK